MIKITIDDKIADKIQPKGFKKICKIAGDVISGAIGVAVVAGIIFIGARSCYQTVWGEEENTRVVKVDKYLEFDPTDGAYMGETPIIYIDKDKRCLEVVKYTGGMIKEGDILKYISWDFNPRPWRCNKIDEYEIDKTKSPKSEK